MNSHMNHGVWRIATLLLAMALGGCRARPTVVEPGEAAGIDEGLSNGYSLLHELVSKQKNLDKLLWLKSPPPELAELIREAAKVSADAESSIAKFAGEDSAIALDRQDLPPVERGVREAIEATTTRRLLFTSEDFAVVLALKQIEATEYGLHLAKVIAEADKNDARRTWLAQFEKSYTNLRDRFTAFLAGN